MEQGTTVELGPCVGGLVKTFGPDGDERLFSVPDDSWLRAVQGTGRLSRVPRSDVLMRECAQLTDDGLLVRPRLPVQTPAGLTMAAQTVALAEPKRPSRATFEDFRELLSRAVAHCAGTYEFVVVERGANPPGRSPMCLFAIMPDGGGHVTVVEASPPPRDSELWAPVVRVGEPSATLSAPSTPEAIETAPMLMIDVISGWGIDPWDLTLAFGLR